MKKTTLLKVSCLVILLSAKMVFAQIPSNGLVGYFPFSGNANDQSGSGITGTLSSGGFPGNTLPVLTADRNGNANSAYDFVGTSLSTSFIDLGQPAAFNFGTTSSFSIALWMKFTVFQVSATMFANNAWHLGIRNLSGNDHLNFLFGGASFNSDSVMTPGTWIHVAGVYNQANQTLEMYIGGALATGFSYNGSIYGPQFQPSLSTSAFSLDGTPTGTTQIGLVDIYTTTNFKGAMDDILIYNRALSPGEVNGIFNATSGPTEIEEPATTNFFTVGPNPGNGIFNVKISNALPGESTLRVYNIEGQLVLKQNNINNNQQIDLSEFGMGNYLIKLESPTGFYTQQVSVIE